MASNEDIKITVVADTKDAVDGLKDMEKASDKTTKSMVKDGRDIEKSLDGVEKSAKDIQSAFKNIDMKSLTSGLKSFYKEAKNVAVNVGKQLQDALNVKGSVDAKVNMTTDASSGANNSTLSDVASSMLSSGAIGSQIAKTLAQTQPVMKNTVSAWKSTIEQADLFERIDDDFIAQMDNLKSQIYPTINAIKNEMSKELSEGEEIEFEYDFKDFTNGITIVKGLVEDLYNDLNQPLKLNDDGLKEVRKELWGMAHDVDNFTFGLSEAAQEMLSLTKARGIDGGFSEEKLQKSLVLLQQMGQELTDLQHVGLGVQFTETLEGELSKITAMAKTFEANPLKMNAQPLIEEFRFLQQEADKVGLKLKGVQSVLQQYSQVDANATKLTNEFKNSLSSVCQQFVSYESRLKIAQQRQQGLANAQNSFQRSIVQVKSSFQQFGLAVKESFNSFNQAKKHLSSMITKVKEWGKAHLSVGKQVKSVNKSIATSFKSILSSMLPFMTVIGAFNLLKESTTDAMGAIEDTNMFMAVFGQNASEMDSWIKQLNADTGLGVGQTKQFTAIIGQMGSAMGLTSEEAMDMSKSMAQMAGDISSFYNVDVAQAQEDLRSALSGSNEVLTKYGIVLREDTIKQYAYANGIATVGAELTSAQRAMALTMMVEQQLGQANGDLAKTMDTPAGRARRLSTAFDELKVALGNVVLPIWNAVMPGLIALANALTSIFNTIARVINGILSLFGMGLEFGGSGGGGGVVDQVESLGTALDDGLGSAGGAAGDVADDLADGSKSAKEIKKYLSGLDELNLTPEKSDSGSSGGSGGSGGSSGGGAGGAGGGSLGSIGDAYKVVQEGESIFDEMTDQAQAFVDAFKEVWSKIALGFLPYKEDILAHWNLLKLNLQTLGQEIVNFFTSCWRNGGSDIAIHLGSLAATITETFLSICNIVVESVTNLFKHLNPDSNGNVLKFITALDDMILSVKRFVDDFDKHFQTFMSSGGQAFINNLGDIAFILGTILVQAITDFNTAYNDFMNSDLGKATIEALAGALEKLSGWIENVLTFVRDNQGVFEALAVGVIVAYEAFKLFSFISKIVAGVQAFITAFGGIAGIVSSVVAFITSPIGIAIAIIGALVAVGVLVYKNWETIKDKAKQIWSAVVKWFNEAGIDIERIVKDMWQAIKKRFNDIKDIITVQIKSAWDVIKTTFTAIYNVIKSILVSIWDIIKSTFNVILTTIQTVLALIVGVFTGNWDSCKQVTLKLLNAIVDLMKSILMGGIRIITSIIGGVGDIFKSAWNGAVNITKTVFQKLVDAIKEKLNKARDFIKGIVDRIKGFFNFTFTIPKIKLPHFSIKPSGWKLSDLLQGSIPKLGIDWYAKGGIMTKPTAFGMNGSNLMVGGEAGAEGIIPLSKLWQELGRQFEKQNQMLSNMNNSSNGGNVTITLAVDGKELARATTKGMSDLARIGALNMDFL